MRPTAQRTQPFIERRQHTRILTLKNAGWFMLALTLAFVAISIRSEMRGRQGHDYGRLVRTALPEVEQRQVDVVPEAVAPVADQTVPDPMLVAPMGREQWLYDMDGRPVALPSPAVDRDAPPADHASVAIVGDSNGVSIGQRARRAPVLSGGFGKPADGQ